MVEYATKILRLSDEQLEEIDKETIDNGIPVRFLQDGCAVDIINGTKYPRGTNVLYHPVYWHFSKETSIKIGKWLSLKPVFDKEK